MRSPITTLSMLAVSAALAGACNATASGSSRSDLERIVTDNHLVAVAYRAESKGQGACIHGMRTGEITSDDEAARCLIESLTASGLEQAIERFRSHVLAIGRRGSGDCRAAAGHLADAIAEEQRFIHATREDLGRDDAAAFQRDGLRAGEAAAREADPSGALLRACSKD
jgi:hypothetical protein